MEKILKNVMDMDFKYDVVSIDEISSLSAGYIILPTGEIIEVKDDEDHASKFSNYLNNYFCRKELKYLDILEASRELTNINCIVYLGIRTEDIKTSLVGLGYGIFILPNNYEENITIGQKNACLKIIESNKSLFGDYEKMDLQFQKIGEKESILRDEFMDILQSKKNKSK